MMRFNLSDQAEALSRLGASTINFGMTKQGGDND